MGMRATFFIQDCPTCDRPLRVDVECLGKPVQCRYCRSVFTGCDPDSSPGGMNSTSALLHRVEELLATAPGMGQPRG